jgi:hypothetical protein
VLAASALLVPVRKQATTRYASSGPFCRHPRSLCRHHRSLLELNATVYSAAALSVWGKVCARVDTSRALRVRSAGGQGQLRPGMRQAPALRTPLRARVPCGGVWWAVWQTGAAGLRLRHRNAACGLSQTQWVRTHCALGVRPGARRRCACAIALRLRGFRAESGGGGRGGRDGGG